MDGGRTGTTGYSFVMLYLASRSPRRSELLARLGVGFGVLEVDVPEARVPGEPAADYVRRVAREKAGAGLLEVVGAPGAVVLGADTEVVLGDEVFGKPRDADDAAAMLRRLSGRTHQVLSSVWLVAPDREVQAMVRHGAPLLRRRLARITDYVATGECDAKAGAYAIQGIAEAFVSRLDGSHSGVMGLPLHETARLLAKIGMGPLA